MSIEVLFDIAEILKTRKSINSDDVLNFIHEYYLNPTLPEVEVHGELKRIIKILDNSGDLSKINFNLLLDIDKLTAKEFERIRYEDILDYTQKKISELPLEDVHDYFGILDTNSPTDKSVIYPDVALRPEILARIDKLELTPKNFELAASSNMEVFDLTVEQINHYHPWLGLHQTQREVFENKAMYNNRTLSDNFLKLNFARNLGWRKSDLLWAIKESGLEIHGRPYQYEDLGLHNHKLDRIALPQQTKSLMTRRYYETLYRLSFYRTVDLKLLCKEKYPLEALRFAAHIRKNIPTSEVKNLDYNQLCAILMKN